jgi:hypothetical protein
MKKQLMKTITIGTIIGILLSLSLASSPALACNTQNKYFKSIIVQGEVVNEDLGFPLPLTLDLKLSGFNKVLIGAGTIEDPACGKSIIAVAGSINGHTLTLTGWVVKGIDMAELRGTRVKLVANCNSGDMDFTFGPISNGSPLSGLTFIFIGEGTISIN